MAADRSEVCCCVAPLDDEVAAVRIGDDDRAVGGQDTWLDERTGDEGNIRGDCGRWRVGGGNGARCIVYAGAVVRSP